MWTGPPNITDILVGLKKELESGVQSMIVDHFVTGLNCKLDCFCLDWTVQSGPLTGLPNISDAFSD